MEDNTLTATIDGEFLVVRIRLNEKPVPSVTGKTLVVASSHGNKETELKIEGKHVIIGLNAYIRKK